MLTARWMTLNEAAKRAGRSYSWAHDRMADGRLERRSGTERQILVSAASVAAQIARSQARAKAATPPRLRLVIDNTK
ncbi:hypothetical protein [Pacificitalea manganoxidans]|uniref:hypothetical protein n=1 Tax=Pacificitalea manganoxidans TaxID=1411902 RepID=UPI0012FDD6FF|nr:hypothetical protein [Pacificitalea manganoxidans]MDR6308237.1 hypothetical protein [Pacificitalea manganoxidans]